MNRINCDVIKDLLPLYIDKILSDSSKELVENHLNECENCKKEYENLKTNFISSKIMIDENEDKKNISNLKRMINKDKRYSILIVALIVIIFMITNFAHLSKRDYIDYPYSNIEITTSAEGIVSLSFLGAYELYEYEEDVYDLSIYTSDFLYLTQSVRYQNITVNPNGEEIKTIYYVSNSGREDEVIYGMNPNGEYSGTVTVPRLVLNYYFSMAIIGIIILVIIRLLFKKNIKLKNIIDLIILLFTAYVISHILIMGWSSVTYQILVDFPLILILTALVWLLLFAIKKYKTQKK